MRTKKKFLFIGLILLFCLAPSLWAIQKNMKKVVDEALDFSVKQSMSMYQVMKPQKGVLPRSAENGKLVTCKPAWWTSGFYPGTLWYCYEYSNNTQVKVAAEEMTSRVEKQKFTTNNHDVGFIINCSFGNGYRLTQNEAYREVIETAAKSLSTRYHSKTGCTRSWNSKNWQFPVIIDNMMNLELFTVASSLTGDNSFYNIAKSHADCTRINHFRPDGSSFHVVNYDTITGKVLNQLTHQGVNDHSAWSRGQAWGLYGFTMMYRQTGKKEYLNHAIKIGEFIMNHPRLPKDKIPYWDFDAPNIPKEDRDASAGAIMASAFVELSTYVERKLGKQFRSLAEKQITSLASSAYCAKKVGDNNHFIIKHCTGFVKKQYEIDASLTYADYYFVEALVRYKNLLEGRPVVEISSTFSENPDRSLWLSALNRIAYPLLFNMANEKIRKNMPVESISSNVQKRREVTHLEALGRLITGMAPWLELGPDSSIEGQLRAKYIQLALKSITNGVNPESPDYLNFNRGRQPLVDAAFLSHGLLRARTQLWDKLDKTTQERIVKELKSSRVIKPSETNWLFFSAMIEVALKEFTGEWEYERVKYACDRFAQWYKGDGWYGDGATFHWDYYNSLVIHPMMFEVLSIMKKHQVEGAIPYDIELARYSRYAESQERLISPEGTFPIVGRSLAYRFGAFHALSDVSYRKLLPAQVKPSQVRCALTAVINRQLNVPGTFNSDGWLQVGFAGHQPRIGEAYISTGSLYLCSAVFIALGLPETDAFWTSPAAEWTCKKGWRGVDIQADKALKE